MIRGIVDYRLGNRIFLRPAECTCDECPRLDLTQANIHTDIDKIAIGDKIESHTGQMWHRVDEFTPDPSQDMANEFLQRLFAANTGNEQAVHEALFGGEGFGPQRTLN